MVYITQNPWKKLWYFCAYTGHADIHRLDKILKRIGRERLENTNEQGKI